MKAFFIFLSYFLFTAPLVLAAPAPTISYTISPLKKGAHHSFLVEMRFKGTKTGRTKLSLPYETGLYRPQDHVSITGITNSSGHQFLPGDSAQYIIEHKPNAQLTVRYTIQNALRDSVPAADEVYAQMLTNNYFYLIGSSCWIVPEDTSGRTYNIGLTWKGFPAKWSWLNSFDANNSSQQISATLSDFQYAIYLGGDIRIHEMLIHNRPLHVGIRGQWSFEDQQLVELIKKTVTAQRAYWNDYEVDRYTIALLPMKYYSGSERSITGRGLFNTFVTIGTNSKAFGLEDLVFLYNHELMHHWLGQVLKQGEPENAFKWFNEGFTDYFAHIIMLESGLLDEAGFKKSINTTFANYYRDSTNQWPNIKLQQDYWASPAIQQLPYQRGLIFALFLDESTRLYSKGKFTLKAIMQQLFAEAKQHKSAFSPGWLLQLLQKASGHDYKNELERFITAGHFISMPDWESVTDKIAMKATRVFDLGFTTDKAAIALNARITAVDEGSNVKKAGLLVNDIVAGFSSTYQPTDSTTLIVKRGGERITLRFLPGRQLLVPQLK